MVLKAWALMLLLAAAAALLCPSGHRLLQNEQEQCVVRSGGPTPNVTESSGQRTHLMNSHGVSLTVTRSYAVPYGLNNV